MGLQREGESVCLIETLWLQTIWFETLWLQTIDFWQKLDNHLIGRMGVWVYYTSSLCLYVKERRIKKIKKIKKLECEKCYLVIAVLWLKHGLLCTEVKRYV